MSHKIDLTSISPLPLTPRSSATRHRQSFFSKHDTRIEKFQRHSRYEPLDRLKVYLTLTFDSKVVLAIGKQLCCYLHNIDNQCCKIIHPLSNKCQMSSRYGP